MHCEAHDELDLEYATSLAAGAVKSMSQHSIAPTPANFAVWFNYVLGSSPALRKTIDILVGNKRKFDAAINCELFSSYVCLQSSRQSVDTGLPQQMETVVANARRFLATAIAENRTQIEALDGVSSQLQAHSDPKLIIESLVRELSRASSRAERLEQDFGATSQELEKIRTSLQEAEQRSNTDGLTGLANRRCLDEFLRKAQIAAMEQGSILSVFLIDIDHFKKFNDTYGHQTGDQVIRLVAKVLQDHVRDHDLAARYGGEELMAVLLGADLGSCMDVAERVRQTIAERRMRRRTTGEELARVTVSIGVAQFRMGESAEALTERCDRALYEAKRAGRNRTVVEEPIAAEIAAA